MFFEFLLKAVILRISTSEMRPQEFFKRHVFIGLPQKKYSLYIRTIRL